MPGTRIPRWPGEIEAGTVEDEPISGVDVLPTLCELAGVEVPGDRPIDGTSITSLFDGETVEREKPLFWHYYRAIGRPKAAMRVGDWMILGHWSGPENPVTFNVDEKSMKLIKRAELVDFELYNLADDPVQRRNVADQYPDRLERMKERLVRRYREVRAEGPEWGLLSGGSEGSE
jgi:arylsulfatase A